MKRYCQIKDGICWWIFESETPPEFAPDIVIKDISDTKYDYVREGFTYDETTDRFNEPVIPVPIMPTQPDLHAITQDTLIEEKYQTLLMETIISSL